jgi:hypothetical protein
MMDDPNTEKIIPDIWDRAGRFDMKNSPKLCLTIAAIVAATVVSSESVFARGGGAGSILNSPGYQRRLQESRQQLSQPDVQPSSTNRRKSRHRHWH